MHDDLVPLRLVPVEVFGTEDCCLHDPPPYSSRPPYAGDEECESAGYGLSDAVSAWSDCNRATGRIYRVDDVEEQYRLPGETVTIYVPRASLSFFERVFGDG